MCMVISLLSHMDEVHGCDEDKGMYSYILVRDKYVKT